jgi:hypothetical protein
MGREIKGQFRSATSGGGSKTKTDVWDMATTEPPPTGEPPECAWCPICRAARRVRQSGPGLPAQVVGAGDALLSVAQDAFSAVEATLSSRPPGTPPHAGHRPAESPPGPSNDAAPSAATAAAATGTTTAAGTATRASAAAPVTAASGGTGTGWPGEGSAHPHHPAGPEAGLGGPGAGLGAGPGAVPHTDTGPHTNNSAAPDGPDDRA